MIIQSINPSLKDISEKRKTFRIFYAKEINKMGLAFTDPVILDPNISGIG